VKRVQRAHGLLGFRELSTYKEMNTWQTYLLGEQFTHQEALACKHIERGEPVLQAAVDLRLVGSRHLCWPGVRAYALEFVDEDTARRHPQGLNNHVTR